ncbi:MAG: choice-of-anchor J domain-containing protein [Muribaculaceae bacterium]|nr:choice-of-anchor J domain-containing protein [Muribaculaceae bacterium]
MKRLLQTMAIAAAVTAVAVPSLADEAAKLATRATAPSAGSATTRLATDQAAEITPTASRRFIQAPAPNSGIRRATPAEAANVPTIYGTVTQSSYGAVTYNKPGVYEIPTADGADFEPVALGIEAKYGATLIGSVLYVPTQEDVDFFGTFYGIDKYDINNEYESLGSNSVSNDHFKSRCTAPDPTEENIAYGCFYNGDKGYNFSKVNYVTRQETVIKAISTQWQLCGINAEGELYAIDSSKKLYRVDKSTGEQTLLTTLDDLYLSGWNAGVFDLKSGLLYISSSKSWNGTKAALYSLDVTTFELVKIHEYEYGETLSSMFIPVSNIPANAPAAPTDLAVDFAGGSLSGTVSFTMPATYYDGSAASGAFHYSITIDGVEAANGIEVAGGQVVAQVTAPSEGQHKIEVTCFNANGNSPKLKTSLYIGKDAPLAVTNVTATYNDGNIHISWDAASGSVNGGYVDPTQTTYTITRQPGAVVIAENISATEFNTTFAAPDGELTSFTFDVVATYDNRTSATATSNPVVIGNLTAPHTWTFDTSTALAGCTIINANDDNYTWSLDTYGKCIKVRYNASLPMDDWFITEPIKLQGGFQYTLAFDVKASSARFSEHIEVSYGTANTVAGMTHKLVEPFEIANTSYETQTVKFTPEADGIYYIGFHGCSAKDRNNLFLSNINLTAGAAPVAPGAVTALTVTPDADGHKSVTISFVAPATNVDGTTLNACDIIVKRDAQEIKTFSNVAASQQLTFTDTPETGGEHTYSVMAVANGLEGETQSQTVFVGLKKPQPATDVAVIETATDGQVTVTWTAPALDTDGNTINQALVRYNVYFTDGESDFALVGDKVEGTSLTHTVNDGSRQSLALYLVEAVTDGGTADRTASEAVAVGKAFTLPYADSFAEPNDYIYGTRSLKGTNQWMTLDDYTVDIVESADNDNAFLAVQQTGAPAISEFFTGKISLAGY